ncbi:MAG: ribosome maturation factor RimP [Rhodospirillaceae bacterium]|nr:ribosome maturation factor RimP [Rhodospirillaceae bacterium]MDD9918612.1 ribosome maturation factor RimP [Rhodospirillaceae bacterium]MDD9926284.1 ribosome maturation factor RimP [Rhodospirillaceae bacterium]
MDPAKRVETIIAPTLQDMGFDLVRVRISGAQRRTLQIMAERLDDGTMTVEDCAAISRAVSALLDVEDPIKGSYTLEVSSPGLDRPLTRPKDYTRFAGLEAKIELREPMDGQRRFRGRIAGLADDQVQLDTEDTRVAIPYADIERAKLILNDELLALAGETQH